MYVINQKFIYFIQVAKYIYLYAFERAKPLSETKRGLKKVT